jgi:glycosyltransferase involved in cell wall biosynthesis
MKILSVHNFYQQRGGEDAVVASESELLMAGGHAVVPYERHNSELRDIGPVGAIINAVGTVWAPKSYRALTRLLRKEKPDVAHFHNTFPLISPSAYYACAEAGVPVVQTLHNYRLLCPGGTFMRDGMVCESCLGRTIAFPAVAYRCYRGSFPQTTVLAAMLAAHKGIQTWQRKVNVYIALSQFARQKFIEGGLPPDRIVVKPNFVHPDPGAKVRRGQYALFLGRLSEEKGLRVLLRAWTMLEQTIPLYVIGDGPMRDEIQVEIERLKLSHVNAIGSIASTEVSKWMHGARFLVCPGLSYEGFPLTIAEAFACALPVIASRLGSLEEIVSNEQTGLHVEPGNVEDLARKVQWAWSHPERVDQMGQQARIKFEKEYAAKQNFKALMDIYRQATALSSDYNQRRTSLFRGKHEKILTTPEDQNVR